MGSRVEDGLEWKKYLRYLRLRLFESSCSGSDEKGLDWDKYSGMEKSDWLLEIFLSRNWRLSCVQTKLV